MKYSEKKNEYIKEKWGDPTFKLWRGVLGSHNADFFPIRIQRESLCSIKLIAKMATSSEVQIKYVFIELYKKAYPSLEKKTNSIELDKTYGTKWKKIRNSTGNGVRTERKLREKIAIITCFLEQGYFTTTYKNEKSNSHQSSLFNLFKQTTLSSNSQNLEMMKVCTGFCFF